MRNACHNCLYKEIPRVSDLTMGDFWGIKNQSEEDMFNGISLLFVNSKKGEKLLESIQSEIILEERTLDEAIEGNACILENAKPGKNREKFFSMLDTEKFSVAVKTCIKKTPIQKVQSVCQKILAKSKRIINRIRR